MDHQSYINPNILYQINELEANESSFDLDEFINQYTASSETWENTSFEPATQEVQTEYCDETMPQIWDNDAYEWMTTAENFEMPLGDLSLTAAQPNLPSASSSQSNAFISFEEFEQFIYPSPTSQNCSSGSSSSSSSTHSDTSSPTSSTPSDLRSPNTHSPPPPLSSSSIIFTCSFCTRTFAKNHELNRHKNQHTKPISCPILSCSHRTAKTRDMHRHVIVHHAKEAPVKVPRFRCPVGGCKHAEMGFKRRDHLVRHVRKLHPGVAV